MALAVEPFGVECNPKAGREGDDKDPDKGVKGGSVYEVPMEGLLGLEGSWRESKSLRGAATFKQWVEGDTTQQPMAIQWALHPRRGTRNYNQ